MTFSLLSELFSLDPIPRDRFASVAGCFFEFAVLGFGRVWVFLGDAETFFIMAHCWPWHVGHNALTTPRWSCATRKARTSSFSHACGKRWPGAGGSPTAGRVRVDIRLPLLT
jgi:hypothetical protein